MKTWNEETKQRWVAEMKSHQDADRLIRGQWLHDSNCCGCFNKGCFFGCAMQTKIDPLKKAIEAMKLPSWLIYLAERIYEGLPEDEYLDFPVKLLESIPVNTDITSVKHDLAILRLEGLVNADNGVLVNDAIEGVIHCHRNYRSIRPSVWSAARSAARSAADSIEDSVGQLDDWAALTAAYTADESAKPAAEPSTADSAEWAAKSADESADELATCSSSWSDEAYRLIKLLSKLR